MKKVYLLLTSISIFFGSCALFSGLFGEGRGGTNIVRWPGKSEEKQSRVLQGEIRPDIFNDFLWTTPDLKSVKLDVFVEYGIQKLRFDFAGETYNLEIAGHTQMKMKTAGGDTIVLDGKKSQNDRYYDISRLKIVSVAEQRWVPKTKIVSETVPVQKSRVVFDTVTNADGTVSTVSRTEFYTDSETHFVPKTVWEWETYYRSMVDIPVYNYFEVPAGEGRKLLIYQTTEGGSLSYYLQNPAYLTAVEREESFLKIRDVRIMILDSNCNGFYSDPEDLILFNVWNPYAKDSSYRSIQGLMDNKWFELSFLESEYFLTVETDNTGTIRFNNENDLYVGSDSEGTLTIDNRTERECSLFVNGKQYKSPGPGLNDYKIQYGKFNLVMIQEGFTDYKETFTINEDNNSKVIVFNPENPAGTLRLINLFAENWSVEYSLDGETITVFNVSELRLPPGHYSLTVTVDGLPLTRSVEITQGSVTELDYETEIKQLDQ